MPDPAFTTELIETVSELARAEQPGPAALHFARFAYPELDVDRYLAWLDRAADRVVGSDHLALRRVIGIAEGLGGNIDDYYDPDNSFLHRVIETRRGIPITLSVIWIEVGRRAGIEVEGIGLPGHFVIRVAGRLVDPFHYGEDIGLDEAAALVGAAIGHTPSIRESDLVTNDAVMILTRMAHNLQRIHAQRQDYTGLEWTRRLIERLAPHS